MHSNAVPFAQRSSKSKAATRMCGIIGVFKHDGSANVEIYEGLLMLQHRGQDSAGMVTTDGAAMLLPPPVLACSRAHSLTCSLTCSLTHSLALQAINSTSTRRTGW